jgi:hypothetical protein
MANDFAKAVQALTGSFPHLQKTEVLERLLAAWRALQPAGGETLATCDQNVDAAKALLVLAMGTLEIRRQLEELVAGADPDAVILQEVSE